MEDDFKLGDVRIRPREREIEVAGEIRRIDHKAFQLLLCLVDQAGVPVSKREIFDRVWKQDLVTDDVLTVGISRLRRALGDEARSPRFIETIPHVGYRLIADVSRPEPAPEIAAARSAGSTAWRWPLAVLAVIAVGFGLYVLWLAQGETPEEALQIQALAVLPLENLTGDPAEGHLADGMTEGLITGLVGRHGLRIASRASVNRFEVKRPAPGDIAQQLGVDALVEGSVQRVRDRVRVSIRLIDAGSGHHLWATSVDGDKSSFFDLQELLVAKLYARLRPEDPRRPSSLTTTVDPSAYESYLRGRYLLQQSASAPLERLTNAVRHLETAITLAPDFAEAHAALAETWLKLGERSLMPSSIAFPKARTATERLLTLGQDRAKALALLATVHFLYDWDFVAADQTFIRALTLDPDEILARDGYSRYLTVMGRFDEALEQQRILRDLNPLIYHQPYLAYVLNMARRHQAALAELQVQLQIEPRSARLYSHLTSTYRWLGRPQEGRRSFATYLRMSGASDHQIEQIDRTFATSGMVGLADLLDQHYALLTAQGRFIPAMSRAEIWALAGDRDAAIASLNQAVLNREPDLLLIAQSPDYDVLRNDPRFQEIHRRVFGHALMSKSQ